MSHVAVPQLSRASYAAYSHLAMGLIATGVLLGLGMVSIVIAGILYILLLLLVTAWKCEYGMAIAFSVAPFVNDLPLNLPVHISIGEFSLIWLFLLCVPTVLGRRHGFKMGPVLIPVLLYLGCCTASTALHWNAEALTPLVQMSLYLIIAVFVYASFSKHPERLTVVYDLCIMTAALLAFLALVTDYSFLSMNKNAWGASMGTVAVMAVERWLAATGRYRRRALMIALVLIVSCLLFSLSRGGWIGAFVGCCVVLGMRGRIKLAFKLAMLLIPLVAGLWFFMPQADKEYATGFTSDRVNVRARWDTIDAAERIYKNNPAMGIGVQLRKDMDATNLVMITLAETGVQGLLALVAIHVTVIVMVWRDLRRIPITSPLYSIAILGAALVAARFTHGLVDHYWSRGAVLQAWAAVGMATAAHFAIKSRGRVKKKQQVVERVQRVTVTRMRPVM